MKRMIIVLFVCSSWQITAAQSKAEVMLEQIADLATSLSTLKEGYKVTTQGLGNVADLKGGTFNQHQSYFNSLKQINPAVGHNPNIPAIAKEQQTIVRLFQQEIAWQQQQAILTKDELAYLQSVYDNLLEDCNKDVDELNLIAKPGNQMSDAERIKFIEHIYGETTDKYQFAQSFLHKSHAFALDRKASREQKKALKKLYGIN